MSYVYIVEAENALIKIGCSLCPEQRLSAIRTHTPLLTRLVAMWPGNYADERALHARFKPHRHHCEWFHVRGDVAVFLAEKRGEGLSYLPSWSDVSAVGLGGVGTPAGQARREAARQARNLNPVWVWCRKYNYASQAGLRKLRKRLGEVGRPGEAYTVWCNGAKDLFDADYLIDRPFPRGFSKAQWAATPSHLLNQLPEVLLAPTPRAPAEAAA